MLKGFFHDKLFLACTQILVAHTGLKAKTRLNTAESGTEIQTPEVFELFLARSKPDVINVLNPMHSSRVITGQRKFPVGSQDVIFVQETKK